MLQCRATVPCYSAVLQCLLQRCVVIPFQQVPVRFRRLGEGGDGQVFVRGVDSRSTAPQCRSILFYLAEAYFLMNQAKFEPEENREESLVRNGTEVPCYSVVLQCCIAMLQDHVPKTPITSDSSVPFDDSSAIRLDYCQYNRHSDGRSLPYWQQHRKNQAARYCVRSLD